MNEILQATERNSVVLVSKDDQEISVMDKLEAHQKGILHRAFSIFIFNNQGEMLLQQRADQKYHGGGLWTNACCSHPQKGEDLLQSAKNRLMFEMGLHCDIKKIFAFIYKAEVENNLIEHEFDHVFVGFTDVNPKPNSEEVKNFQWIQPGVLLQKIDSEPELFTTWFKMVVERVLNETKR